MAMAAATTVPATIVDYQRHRAPDVLEERNQNDSQNTYRGEDFRIWASSQALQIGSFELWV
jgi:hypothetical protein